MRLTIPDPRGGCAGDPGMSTWNVKLYLVTLFRDVNVTQARQFQRLLSDSERMQHFLVFLEINRDLVGCEIHWTPPCYYAAGLRRKAEVKDGTTPSPEGVMWATGSNCLKPSYF